MAYILLIDTKIGDINPACVDQVIKMQGNIKKMKYVNGVYAPSHLAMQGNVKHIDHWKRQLLGVS